MKTHEIRTIIDKTLGIDRKPAPEPLNEAYVALPKTYDMPTEMLSEKTKKAHFELYEGYVRKLNDTSAKLDTAERKGLLAGTNDYRSLKLDETHNLNAVWLHELYFANMSDVHSEVFSDSLAFMRLERDFGGGGFEGWQWDMIACAMSAQSGWAVTGYHMFLQRYINTFIDGHDCHVPVGLYPVIVLDCWEHASRDVYNDRELYIKSMMTEIRWSIVDERFKKAERIAEALGGPPR